nr:penicillin acylase family protein [Blastocatellia bacterium]
MKITLFFILALLVSAAGPVTFESAVAPFAASSAESVRETRQRVEIVRTAYGVPHIRAEDLRAAGYGLAWVQSEDHGSRTGMRVLAASGRWASVEGFERIDSDFAIRREHIKNAGKYASLSQDVRDVYEGFAEGLNRYIELNPQHFPAGMPTDLTGFDVLATEFSQPSAQKIRNFINRLNNKDAPVVDDNDAEGEGPDDGSNAWALAPNRTTSGKAILVRNPHLRWSAGYYEAHMTVPGVIDFYGDFRIGGPFGVIGGFNRDLGFSTTNNNQDLDEIYALDADPEEPDSYLLDGKSVSVTQHVIAVPFKNGDAIATEAREFWSTEFGPVIHR